MLLPSVVAIPHVRRESHVGPGAFAPFALGRTPVVNREYSGFLAAGRAPAPPWWGRPRVLGPRTAGRRRDLGRGHGLLRVALGNHRRNVAVAERGRMGARGLRGAFRTGDFLGGCGPGRRDPRRPPHGPLGGRPRNAQRLRPLRHGNDRSRVVPRLAHARGRRCAAGQPRGVVASPGPMVGAVGIDQPSARLPLLRLRVSRPARGSSRERGRAGAGAEEPGRVE